MGPIQDIPLTYMAAPLSFHAQRRSVSIRFLAQLVSFHERQWSCGRITATVNSDLPRFSFLTKKVSNTKQKKRIRKEDIDAQCMLCQAKSSFAPAAVYLRLRYCHSDRS